MKPSLALFASTAPVLGGCASQETTLETEQAHQAGWASAQPAMNYSHISLTFDGQGRAFGNGGCNHWFASYTLQDDFFQFDVIGSACRLCVAEIMEQERHFLALLQSVQHWDISPSNELRLWPAENKPLCLVPECGRSLKRHCLAPSVYIFLTSISFPPDHHVPRLPYLRPETLDVRLTQHRDT